MKIRDLIEELSLDCLKRRLNPNTLYLDYISYHKLIEELKELSFTKELKSINVYTTQSGFSLKVFTFKDFNPNSYHIQLINK